MIIIRRLLCFFILFNISFIVNAKVENKMNNPSNTETAIFAMGCFWCGESEFRNHHTKEKLPGIISIRVGYAGGTQPNPTYENHHGYKEAVKVEYKPNVVSYNDLLDIFWKNVDPFDEHGQFCDKGFAYTSAIFFKSDKQRNEAEKSKARVEKLLNNQIKTELIQATTYYDAEEYHQNYETKNPTTYKFYRWNCGRDKRLKSIWKN